MKSFKSAVGLALSLAALLPARAFLDQEANDIRVDVVVDLTDAGRKIIRPSPDQPAYYLPLSVGYQEMGAYVTGQKPPPPKAEVEYWLSQALSAQGYQIMTKISPPSLVLVFWWGHMAPEISDTTTQAPHSATQGIDITLLPIHGGKPNGNAGTGMTDPRALVAQLHTDQIVNYSQMVSLVAGNTRDYQHPTEKPNPILQQILDMERQPRHYLMISAYDFHDWLHHKGTLLWQAHVSTELWGRSLRDVMEPMIAAAAPLFGRETIAPRLIGAPVAHVIVGKPEVKGFPALHVPPPPFGNQ